MSIKRTTRALCQDNRCSRSLAGDKRRRRKGLLEVIRSNPKLRSNYIRDLSE